MQEYMVRDGNVKKKAPEMAAPDKKFAEPSIMALRTGAVSPQPSQLGRPVSLEAAIRAKMESAFGMDLSALRIYASQTVEDAGAEAVAQGNRIAFAPGETDFHSRRGQMLLGHEISHVVSQARDGVSGRGLLENPSLEAQADREGKMAADGETVYSGPALGTLSSAAPSAALSAPMQAKSNKAEEKQASKMARLAEKAEHNDMTDRQRRQYESMLNKSMSDPRMMQAFYRKQTEKRQKEMERYQTPDGKAQSAERKKYHSQDRYAFLLRDLEKRANAGTEEQQKAYQNAKNIAMKGSAPDERNKRLRHIPGLGQNADFLSINQRWESEGWRGKPAQDNAPAQAPRNAAPVEVPQNVGQEAGMAGVDVLEEMIANHREGERFDQDELLRRMAALRGEENEENVHPNLASQQNSMKEIMNMKDLMNRKKAPQRTQEENDALLAQLRQDNARQQQEDDDFYDDAYYDAYQELTPKLPPDMPMEEKENRFRARAAEIRAAKKKA